MKKIFIFTIILLLTGCSFIVKEEDKVKSVGLTQEEAQKVLKIIEEQKPPDKPSGPAKK